MLATFLLMFIVPLLAYGQTAQPVQIVTFQSGDLHLKGYLWKPAGVGPFPAVLFSHGSGGSDSMHTAGMTVSEAAERLSPVFLKHGYAFFYPCRRGQGLSSDQGRFIQDVLKEEEASKGAQARQKLQFELMTGSQLDDTLAALSFLKTVPGVDARRIALIGHSFGGQLTILAAEREHTLGAAVTFGAAANSWAKSPELRERLLLAIRSTAAPIMLIHAANDYDTAPGQDLSAQLEQLHKRTLLKIYPAVGLNADEGHNLVYNSISIWEFDVFRFLDQNVSRPGHEPEKLRLPVPQ